MEPGEKVQDKCMNVKPAALIKILAPYRTLVYEAHLQFSKGDLVIMRPKVREINQRYKNLW
jgi:hypothetical protein